ncbi:hypothetical protein POM88_053676 [Heracleum sosnowskyi]|uniref:Uncharacterized protein n=1 Tax=Heracleum sosnowskyi TaxID=360622 RepID=A0AAD8LXG3_9APIA|nr:hypothetical protein POM88_053676 [Heracleum sosnowskyi]
MKKKLKIGSQAEGEDRLSSLSDDVRLLVNELENANVDVLDTTEFHNLTLSRKKVFFHRLRRMFWQLGSTKILTIDSATFEVLSAFTNFVEDVASPFYNLKYVKLPKGYKESSISTTMRKFLLGCSPGATIVTGLPQNEEYYQAVHVPSTSQKLLEEPLTTPTAELVDSQDIHKKVCVNRVQVEHLVDSSVGDADRARHAGAPVARKSINQASSSRGNSNFWLWQGLEIKSEFVDLLDLIVKKYPQTFEHFTAKSETFYAMKLNMLCTWVNEFLRTSMPEFCTDIISEYKDGFADLQRWGFNVYWLVDRLNYIEQIRLSQNEVHAIDSSVGDADRARHACTPVAREGIDQASSSRGNSNFWLWQGLEIKSEFVGLLDLIMKKYPETFEHFKAKSEAFYAMKLNVLCTWVDDFLRTSMPEFFTDIISEYKDGFADLQRWGFNRTVVQLILVKVL